MARSNSTFRHATVGLLGSALALTLVGWTASAPQGADASTWPEPQSTPARVDPHPDILGVGRLAAFAASAAQPGAALRNPFAPSDAAVEPEPDNGISPARLRPVVLAPSISPTDAEPAPPTLVGIALEETPGGPARTAVFSTADGGVEFAAAGERVGGGRFRVSDVTADGAVLINVKTGATARLSLQ